MGNEKKAILVSCTDHYRERTYVFDTVLSSEGYETTYLASDFHHIKKEKRNVSAETFLLFFVTA